MTKLFQYLFLALTLVFSFGLTSCSDDDDKNVGSKENLIGTWQCMSYEWEDIEDGNKDSGKENYPTYNHTFEFKENGTIIESSNSWSDTYNYSYKGNKLRFIDDEDPEEYEIYNVTTLNSTDLIFEYHEKGKYEGISYEFHEKYTLKKIHD